MELKLFQRYYIDGEFEGWYFIWLVTKHFQFRWFTDCGEWFFYIHLGKKYWRFSGAGYMKGKIN